MWVTQCWKDKKSRDRESECGEYKAGEVGASVSRDLGGEKKEEEEEVEDWWKRGRRGCNSDIWKKYRSRMVMRCEERSSISCRGCRGLTEYSRWRGGGGGGGELERRGDRRWQHEGRRSSRLGDGRPGARGALTGWRDTRETCLIYAELGWRGWRVEGVWDPLNTPQHRGEQLWVLAVWEGRGMGGVWFYFLRDTREGGGGGGLISLLNSGGGVRLRPL